MDISRRQKHVLRITVPSSCWPPMLEVKHKKLSILQRPRSTISVHIQHLTEFEIHIALVRHCFTRGQFSQISRAGQIPMKSEWEARTMAGSFAERKAYKSQAIQCLVLASCFTFSQHLSLHVLPWNRTGQFEGAHKNCQLLV